MQMFEKKKNILNFLLYFYNYHLYSLLPNKLSIAKPINNSILQEILSIF